MKEMDILKVERLEMRKSKKIEGRFIGRVKTFDNSGNFSGEMIILSDKIQEAGFYKITAERMRNGRGWIVRRWEKLYDEVTTIIDRGRVTVMLNGFPLLYFFDDGKKLPLRFVPKRYVSPQLLLKDLMERLGTGNLSPAFDWELFSADFLGKCREVEKRYKSLIKENYERNK